MTIHNINFTGEDPVSPDIVKKAILATNFKVQNDIESNNILQVIYESWEGQIHITDRNVRIELNPGTIDKVRYVVAAIFAIFGLFLIIGPIIDNSFDLTVMSMGGVILYLAFYLYSFVRSVPNKAFANLIQQLPAAAAAINK